MIRAHGRRVGQADPEDLAELIGDRDVTSGLPCTSCITIGKCGSNSGLDPVTKYAVGLIGGL